MTAVPNSDPIPMKEKKTPSASFQAGCFAEGFLKL